MEKRKIIFIIITGIIIILTLIVGIKLLSENRSKPISEQSPQIVSTAKLPLLDESQGGGVDVQSPLIKLSQQSIDNLQSQLPYNNTLTTAEGVEVEISIPPTDILSNDWTLLVHIFGPDYQVPLQDADYEIMKKAFLAGAADVYAFLNEQNVPLDEIIIEWGDRAIVRDRSEEWLK